MTTDKKFNLIDEQWIPIRERGVFSLRDIFSDPSLRRIGGNPIQKTAIFKLLCAIAQAAWTPKTEEEWRQSTVEDFAGNALLILKSGMKSSGCTATSRFCRSPRLQM